MATTRHNQECVSCGQNIPPRSEINKCAVCLGAMHEDCGHKCVCDNKVCDEHWAGDCCTACTDALREERREKVQIESLCKISINKMYERGKAMLKKERGELEKKLATITKKFKEDSDEIGKRIDKINQALE